MKKVDVISLRFCEKRIYGSRSWIKMLSLHLNSEIGLFKETAFTCALLWHNFDWLF